jgi:hypothetical protein
MIVIQKKSFTEEQFKEIISQSKAKSDCMRKLGFAQNSGPLWKIILKYIEELSISIDHFDSSYYRRERRGLAKDISKENLELELIKNLTLKQLGIVFTCSQSNIKYWIKKFDLKLFRGAKGKLPKDFNIPRMCSCGETDPLKFYGNKISVCAICHNKNNLKRGKEKRLFAINLLGGKCINCGYDTYTCSFDIHHVSPEHKDVNFKSMRGWSEERIIKELVHCVLLCRNCHAACHSGYIQVSK